MATAADHTGVGGGDGGVDGGGDGGGDADTMMTDHIVTAAGVKMPRMIYGTAWKKDNTSALVVQAVRAGFRGVDTACQPKHYKEEGVGAALATLLGSGAGGVAREDLFIQTKVNRHRAAELAGADATIAQQVARSVEVSLANLGLQYVDSLVLHSPYKKHKDTMKCWRAMEEAVRAGKARQLGISNVKSLEQLQRVHAEATIKPVVVQQRFYVKTCFEREMRAWCATAGVAFQSFWTLTANSKRGKPNRDAVLSPIVAKLAAKYRVTPQVLFYRFVMGQGICPLNGTSSAAHMAEDLCARTVPLTAEDAATIDALLVAQTAAAMKG